MRPSYPVVSSRAVLAAREQPSLLALDQIVGPGMSLAQLWAIVRAYRKQALIIAVATLAAATLAIWLLPKTYTATATLVLNYEINDPLGGREFPINLLANYAATQIEIMQSPQVLLPVIDALGLTKDSWYTSGYSGDGSNLREWVVESLRSKLEIRASYAGGQLIYITASARRAAAAATVANRVAETYLDQQVERANAPATAQAKRYAGQMDELRNNVTKAQKRIADFRKQTGIVELNDINDVDLQLMASLEHTYQIAQNERRAAEVRTAGGSSASSTISASPGIESLKTSLSMQRAELAQVQTTLGPRHPRVLELRSQIAATVRALSSGAVTDLASARQLEAKLSTATTQQRDQLIAVRNNQAEGAKLMLELDSARAVYKRALDGYDQIRAAAGGNYSNVSLLSAASVPLKSTRPNKLKWLAVASLLSVGLGLIAPLLYELILNRRVRCADDVERDLGIPVLVEFEFAHMPEAKS